jgi:Domain of unknown function (DUF4384)
MVINRYTPSERALGLTCIVAAAGLWLAAPLSAQSTAKMSAREIFYASAATPKPAKAAPTKPVQRPTAPLHTPDVSGDTSAPARSSESPSVAPSRSQQVELASYTRKLGIRLSIRKIAKSGQTTEVAPDTVFQPGDRVRLNIQVSGDGFLYIINRGSSGTWTQLFPSPDMPGVSNAVAPGVTYSVPPDRNFVVSDPAGEEKLFIILSRTQEDGESLTMDMSKREAGGAGSQTERSLPAPRKPLTVTIAKNLPPMNDSMVDRLRNAYARDLIIEKVDDQTPGERKENAVYAVNPDDGDGTRVVLDAQIKHH